MPHIKYVNKLMGPKETLREHLALKRRERFARDFTHFATQNISFYDSKYVAGFAFDGDTARMLISGIPEKESFDYIFQYLKSKNLMRDAALDIGANYGLISLNLAKHYKNVFCFEPHPVVLEILKFNIEQNNAHKTIKIFDVGLSSQEDELALLDHKAHNIGGSTFEGKNVKTDPSIIKKYVCKVLPLDAIPEVRAQKIGLIKIDAEEHELHVLQGAKQTIQENMPVILMEDWDSRNGVESEAIKFLKALGYKTFLVPVKYPQRKTSKNKVLNYFYRAKKIATLLTKGEQHVLEECDFSSTKGYEMIIVHA